MSSNEQIGYECIDELIRLLQVEGYAEPAAKLHTLLHETGWTTGSELIGELGLVIIAFEQNAPSISPDLRQSLDSSMRFVRRVWPDIK